MVQVPTFSRKLLPRQLCGRSFAATEGGLGRTWDSRLRVKGRSEENNGDKKPVALADYAFPLPDLPMPV